MMAENAAVEDIFRPGDSVMLEFVDQGGVIKNYKTRIEDLDNEYLLLQMPIIKRVPVRIWEGRELTIRRKGVLFNRETDDHLTNPDENSL